MSTHHEPISVKPISEVAAFLKNLLPADIPASYAIKPLFADIANDEDIITGVAAFWDFLYSLLDRLATDGHTYAKPPKKPSSMADYPFVHNLTNLLVDIGYNGQLAKSEDSLLVTRLPACTTTTDKSGKKSSPKIPFTSLKDCIQFLSLCGMVFTGLDPEAKSLNLSELQPLEVSYPANPIVLTGLKAMAIADIELRAGRRYWNDNNLLRCDYRLLMAQEPDMGDVLRDFLHPLPECVRGFSLKLHQRYTGMSLTCINTRLGLESFAYAYLGKNRKAVPERVVYGKRVFEFSYSIKNGYCLYVRPKKTEKNLDTVNTFHPKLQAAIAQGYGCDRKRGERCQHGCQGIGIALDESILEIAGDIEKWLDSEI